MQDRAREKQGWHNGGIESVALWHSAGECCCQEWLYFLGEHWSRRWSVVRAKPLTAGHLNCPESLDSQVRMHMGNHSREARCTTEGEAGDAEIQPWWPMLVTWSQEKLDQSPDLHTPTVPYPATWLLQHKLSLSGIRWPRKEKVGSLGGFGRPLVQISLGREWD